MNAERLHQKSREYLNILCNDISERYVGSKGNRLATRFFENKISSLGWNTEISGLDVIDWIENGASLQFEDKSIDLLVSPYSPGCKIRAQLSNVSNIEELEEREINGTILLMHGKIAKEQLLPKNFDFYKSERHQKIINLLEKKQPAAIISITGRNAAMAGGVYPFPLIEDGDFTIPSVYTAEEKEKELLSLVGHSVLLESQSTRRPAKAYNVIGRKGDNRNERIVISAHIDAKKGTPGAIDNATGIIVLLLLAELLQDYDKEKLIEIVSFNGEDYYSAAGQKKYIRDNQNNFDKIALNINIDGAGYKDGKSAFSSYELPDELQDKFQQTIEEYNGIIEGAPWPQGDHSIFLQRGCPAIAVSSQWLISHIESQRITHTKKDKPEIVDCRKLVEISEAINHFIRKI